MSTNVIPIGTTNPADLSNGLPLFPTLGTVRAGICASSRSYKVVDVSLTVGFLRLIISAYAGYGFGLGGPALAFLSRNVEVKRTNSPTNQGQLAVTFNEGLFVQAGAFVGAYASGAVTLTAQFYLPRPWWKLWSFAWQTAFTIDKDFKVDLLALMFTLIKYLLTRNPKASFDKDLQNKLKEAQPFVTSFILDATAGSSTAVTRNIQPTPQVTAPLNLVNYVPKLRAINESLAKIGGEISVGPTAHLQFPVTFNISKFTIVGGVSGAESAEYANVDYVGGKQVTASGSTPFNLLQSPSRVTTHVTYGTTVKLVLSIHFRVKVAKFFNIEVNTPSLDLTYLLYRVREENRTLVVNNSVSTRTAGGCVLTPTITLSFQGPNGREIKTGDLAKGTVTLTAFQSTTAATIKLEIDPPAPNFPSSAQIRAGSNFVEFPFTFQNQCLLSGNPNAPDERVPPNPISPVQTYRVTAKLDPPLTESCTDYEIVAPLNISHRVLSCNASPTTAPGLRPPPTWDGRASATMKADILGSAPSGSNQASAILWFPYAAGEDTTDASVKFTLLDENREPYSGSDVQINGRSGQSIVLKPSGTLTLTLARSYESAANPTITIVWNSKGRNTGYPNRFYLLVDAGCQYGQTEFWLDVYNWS